VDPRKQDKSPVVLDLGAIQFVIPRHFGFCYGVENAIEISYKALEENPKKNVYLLSQMIHNQVVNNDLEDRGIKFIMDTEGNRFISTEELTPEDIVIIPAFGTTIEIENELKSKGIEIETYNTTCPFVEKVWNRSTKLGNDDYTIIIHGKFRHEETRATFSHSKQYGSSVVVRNMEESKILGEIIMGKRSLDDFEKYFRDKSSDGFDPLKDLRRVGVVNQTTMLADETQAISEYFKGVMIEKYGSENYKNHYADTRDTLCYATNDNQDATFSLLKEEADIAFVVGGYNSSNTSHLVEMLEAKFPTYFINSPDEILSRDELQHFIYTEKRLVKSHQYLDFQKPVRIILTSGASCPDSLVDAVMLKLVSFFPDAKVPSEAIDEMLTIG
jgi:4-hydroxy-3-methylbut-2-enyl diphosphate reductase